MNDLIIDSTQHCPVMSICSSFILLSAHSRTSSTVLMNVFDAAFFNCLSFTIDRKIKEVSDANHRF